MPDYKKAFRAIIKSASNKKIEFDFKNDFITLTDTFDDRFVLCLSSDEMTCIKECLEESEQSA